MNYLARGNALLALNRHYKIKNPVLVENLFDISKNKSLGYQNIKISQPDKALSNEIKNGVIRWQLHIDYLLENLLKNGLKNTAPEIINILRIGVYQILFMDKIPNYAAVYEVVELTKITTNQKLAKLVNGVLRNFLHKKNTLSYPEEFNKYLSVYYSHPIWLVDHWIKTFGESQTQELLKANNSRPNISIRINKLKTNLEEVLSHFERLNELVEVYNNNILLLKKLGDNLENDIFFIEGKITVQDASAALCAELSTPKENNFVIDLCAAPGGKTCYIAELMNNTGEIIANDVSIKKTNLVKENLKRLNILNTKINIGDALDFKSEKKADIVLIDAPCSGFGTIRKLPEIKYNRTSENILELVATQRKLLNKGASLVKSGGTILYSTCSIEPEENFNNIKWFLSNNTEFFLDPADNYIESNYCKDNCLQTFPHIHNIDGAFAARLIKKI